MAISPSVITRTPGDDVAVALEVTLRSVRSVVPFAEGTAMAMDPDSLIPTQFAATFPLSRESSRANRIWYAADLIRNTPAIEVSDAARTAANRLLARTDPPAPYPHPTEAAHGATYPTVSTEDALSEWIDDLAGHANPTETA